MTDMLKQAFRSLFRDIFFSGINLVGLSAGLACVIVIVQLIQHDFSFDKHHQKRGRIYRLIADINEKDAKPEIAAASTSFPLGPALKENFPEIEKCVRFRKSFQGVVSLGSNAYKEPNFYFVDQDVFSVFDFPFQSGDPATALSKPNSVVITPATAKRLFGDADAMGKVIGYNGSGGQKELVVTGVLYPLPSNTIFDFDYLASFSSLNTEGLPWTWFTSLWTYVLVPEGVNPETLVPKMTAFIAQNVPRQDLVGDHEVINIGFEPFESIQLYSRFEMQMKPNSDIRYVYLFGIIAVVVFAMLCFNFISLSTARALRKSREVGIRKIIGANRGQLVMQFMTEAAMLSVISILVSVALLQLLEPFVSGLINREFSVDITQFSNVVLMVILVVTVTLAAGLYPAYQLSSVNPTGVFRSIRQGSSKSNTAVRKGLVFVQFSITSLMIFGTLLVHKQIEYIRSKDLGAAIDKVIFVPALEKAEAFMSELGSYDWVSSSSRVSRIPATRESFDKRMIKVEGIEKAISIENYYVDDRFLETFGIPLIAGENLAELKDTTNADFLINQTAVRFFGWKSAEDAIGREIGWPDGSVKGRVSGVVRDFHLTSLHDRISPLVIGPERYYEFVSIRLSSFDNLEEKLARIQSLWKRYEPQGGYELKFANGSYLSLHQSDLKLGKLSTAFALVSILIASLGLFGLTNYLVHDKTKELAIRKVLGATLLNLISMLSNALLRPVIVGSIVMIPVMFWMAQQWLSGFNYRVELNGFFFVQALGLTLCLAALTVGYKCVRAMMENPVGSLRNE